MTRIERETREAMTRVGEAIIDLIEDSPLICEDMEATFNAVLAAFRMKEEQTKARMRKMDQAELARIMDKIKENLEG